MRPIVFLTSVMKLGYGVSVVIDQLCLQLIQLKINVCVASSDIDKSFHAYPVYKIEPQESSVRDILDQFEDPIVIIHTSPFFEMSESLSRDYHVWAYEHGDPEPSLFSNEEAVHRLQVKKGKAQTCYPHVRGVISISDFITSDICQPTAHRIYNGCDHVPDLGTKSHHELSLLKESSLRIGTLMRLGSGEARYKGNELFFEIFKDAKKRQLNCEFYVAGRGNLNDEKILKDQGFFPKLNITDEQRTEYLRSLDIFISCSLWEGFNLPLVEAQALGTLSLCFDVGAHPEVCPYVVSDFHQMMLLIERFQQDRSLLFDSSRKAYHFVRDRFQWKQTVLQLVSVLYGEDNVSPFFSSENHSIKKSRTLKYKLLIKSGVRHLHSLGFFPTLRKVIRYVFSS